MHFATHAFAEHTFANQFGGLCVARGGAEQMSSEDNGELSAYEIPNLDLRACELAILSACETNVGPGQAGEGVWSLSREFLIAGAHRVVASHWLVDDDSTASLISYFCGGLSNGFKTDSVDYAESLQKAKHWVKSQPKWSHPYYWSGFVLLGPN